MFAHTSGPRNAKIALVGEAWGEQEEKMGLPFIGYSGQELTNMLSQAGIQRSNCFITNVFDFRPKDNKIESICVSKKELPPTYKLPQLSQGKYIAPQYLKEVDRLKEQLLAVNPNLIVALGATACWALLQSTRISALRGTITESVLCPHKKVLPTYHPAAILRNWALRPIAITDFIKAKREAEFDKIIRPKREVLVSPTLEEIEAWATQDHSLLAVDIETTKRQISCIGFARSPSDAIVIPFVDKKGVENNYWPNPSSEAQAWLWVKRLLDHPAPKVFQNGLYDLQYIYRMGFRPRNVLHDTMLLHHALYPELQKGLGFLGSVYTNESAWKLLRDHDSTKRDE
jgi:DNA polymerase